MLGKASVVKTRNQVKDIPVHQERVFSFVAILLFYNTKVRIKSGSPDKPGGLSIQLCKSEKKEFYIRYSS